MGNGNEVGAFDDIYIAEMAMRLYDEQVSGRRYEVRLIAWRDAVKGVGWYPMEGSVMIAEAVAQIYTEWVVVEATTASVRPKFLVLDLHDMSVDVQTGKMIPHIIAEFSDQDAAIMALRMVK